MGEADTRDAVADQLLLARARLKFRLVAWVLMPEHVHLLVVTGVTTTVPKVLMAFKRPVSTRLLMEWRDRNDARLELASMANGKHRFWQAGGGYDRNVTSMDELREKAKYIHENPVRRGLAAHPEDWAWSSARAWKKLDTRWPVVDHPDGATA